MEWPIKVLLESELPEAAPCKGLDVASLEPTYSRSPHSSSALLPTFWGEGSPTKNYCRAKGTLILTSLLEDLVLKVAG